MNLIINKKIVIILVPFIFLLWMLFNCTPGSTDTTTENPNVNQFSISQDDLLNQTMSLSQNISFSGANIWSNNIAFLIKDNTVDNLAINDLSTDFSNASITLTQGELNNISDYIGLISIWPNSFKNSVIKLDLILTNIRSKTIVNKIINSNNIINYTLNSKSNISFNVYPIWSNNIIFTIKNTNVSDLSKTSLNNYFKTQNITLSDNELNYICNYIGIISYWPDNFKNNSIELNNILTIIKNNNL